MKKKKSRFREFFEILAVACVLAFSVKIFVLFPTTVQGASMGPTLRDGDKVIINKLAKRFESYEREDIIVVKTDNFYVKRVIGLPGDVIEMKNDQLYVNHQLQNEPYLDKNKNMQNNSLLT